MTAQSEATTPNVIGTLPNEATTSLPDGFYNRYHDNLVPVIPSTYTIGADGKFTSYNAGDYDPTTVSIANGMDDTIYKPVQYHPNLGGPRRIAAGTYGPDSTEVAPHLSSIHKQDSWTNSEGLWDNNSYFTTTDLSAPLGGTYSLMSNVGENADAPITYDFLNHMPDNYGTTAARGPFGLDVSDPRYTEDYSNTLHNVADNNASRAFQRKHIDAMNARLANYDNNAPTYGVGLGFLAASQNQPYYAVSGTSEVPLENGVEPIPLLGEWVMPNPNDYRPRLNKPTDSVLEWDAGMGPDYEWSEQNYSGYDGNRYKTQDENGSIIEYNLAHQNGVPEERAGTDFNSGDRFKKFNNIPYVNDRVNPAIHPAYQRDGKEVQWKANDRGETYNANAYQDSLDAGNLFQEQQQSLFNQGQSPNSLLMPPSGMDSTGGGGGFGLGYSSGTGTGNYSRGYQQDILGLLDNLIGR